MSLSLRHFLIPRDNTHRPEAQELSQLVESWGEHGYIASPGTRAYALIAQQAEPSAGWSEAMIRREPGPFEFWAPPSSGQPWPEPDCEVTWPMDNAHRLGLRQPLDVELSGEISYALDICLADDFVQLVSAVDAMVDDHCRCGERLGYHAGPTALFKVRVRRSCPRCGEAFRPQERLAQYLDPFSGSSKQLAGGACHRFAIVADFGRSLTNWLESPQPRLPRASKEFLSICETALGVDLYQVADAN